MKTKTPTITKISFATAIALAAFSGSVACYGLTKFAPGAEWVVAVMALGFEAGKLTGFAVLHRPLPRLLKGALLVVGLILMGLNVAGVSGFLSAAYERSHVAAQATAHVAEQTARASASVTERMLATAEQKLAAANQALIRARDDRGRVKAAQAVIATATAERDALVKQLGAARSTEAKAEGAAIEAGGEFAAVAFIASATGADQGTVAHAIILLIATLPDTLAVLLILAAGRTLVPAPTRKPVRRKAVRRRKSAILKVVPNEQAA